MQEPGVCGMWFFSFRFAPGFHQRRAVSSSVRIGMLISPPHHKTSYGDHYPMQYLITGGAGFIASHIAEELIRQNHDVTLLDDMSAGNVRNIQSGAEFIKGSVTDRPLLSEICKTHAFEGIFHLAAVASVQKSIEDPLLVHEVNATGTLNILSAAKE